MLLGSLETLVMGALNLTCHSAGFKVVNSGEQHPRPSKEWMLLEMGRSVFCLTPTGAGWGTRLKLAVMFRCIPVIINQDVQASHIVQAMFLDIIPILVVTA